MKKEENNKSVHSGHRQRMKQRFVKQGIAGFADHEALEMLLFYAIPQRDTNELAHNLINEFGSLDGVFDASVDALTAVKGVGENTAILIKLMLSMYSKYFECKNDRPKPMLETSEDSCKFFLPMFLEYQHEVLIAAFLDNNLVVRRVSIISEGDLERLDVNFKKIISMADNSHCNKIIIAHNHPSGVAAPSPMDVMAVKEIRKRLNSVAITLCDSIIVAGGEAFSMANHSKYRSLF